MKLASVAVYNSAQQLLVKPATEGRHTVPLRQLDEFFGGGSTNDLGERVFSLTKIPPVDTSLPIADREPYVFCRDSDNKFSGKKYSVLAKERNLVERDEYGRMYAKAPDSNATPSDNNVVNVDYFNRILSKNLSNYLPLAGGAMTGTLTIKNGNPALKFTDTTDNSNSYVQSYKGKLRLGYAWQNSLAIDKNGNVEVFGSLSCPDPVEDKHAVTLGYLKTGIIGDIQGLTERTKGLEDKTSVMVPVLLDFTTGDGRVSKRTVYLKCSEGIAYRNSYGYIYVDGIGQCTETDIIISPTYEGKEVNYITKLAFENCENLFSIILPDSVTYIGRDAFRKCTNLVLTELPAGVTRIDSDAFYGCTNIALTKLPDGITNIYYNVFENCENLALTELPDGITSIGGCAFKNCKKLTLTELPSGVRSVGMSAFENCENLALSSLPSDLFDISRKAFANCPNNTFTSLPEYLTWVGDKAFDGCLTLQTVTFKKLVQSLSSEAFSGCPNLTTINVSWPEGFVNGAPWGANNATINYSGTTATVTILDWSYTIIEGMTWTDFVNMGDNQVEWYADANGVWFNSTRIVHGSGDKMGEYCYGDEVIDTSVYYIGEEV